MIAAVKQFLQGEKLSFSPLHIDNLYAHFEWNNDPELNRMDSEMPYVRETLGNFKRRFERLVEKPSPVSQDFEIHALDGTLIGVAYISHISESSRHCMCGITIGDRDYWGKGYGRDALRVLLDYCFSELDMHLVMAETFEYNDAWRKLVKWAGFEREGLIREYLYREGRYWDKEMYSLREGDFVLQNLTLNGHAGSV